MLVFALHGCDDGTAAADPDQWPVLIWVMETSASMKGEVPGSDKVTAFHMLKDIIAAYSKHSFPVRVGGVTYSRSWKKAVYPSKTKKNNMDIVQYALSIEMLDEGNDLSSGLKLGQTMMTGSSGAHRHVVVIGTSVPDRAWKCKDDKTCCVNAARSEASKVRTTANASLHTVEIRRAKHDPSVTKFLRQIAGRAGTSGNDSSMHHVVKSQADVDVFITALTRVTCAFGPLPLFSSTSAPSVYIRDVNGDEIMIPQVANRDTVSSAGFEYQIKGNDARVILTMKSCNDLGATPRRRLVVRW